MAWNFIGKNYNMKRKRKGKMPELYVRSVKIDYKEDDILLDQLIELLLYGSESSDKQKDSQNGEIDSKKEIKEDG